MSLREVWPSRILLAMAQRIDLLERMRRSKAGWRPDDLARLFSSFGFDAVAGGKQVDELRKRLEEADDDNDG